MSKYYTIPIFIPEQACPFQCVFCNQRKISGHISIPTHSEVIKIVNDHLASFKQKDRIVDVAFFGGNFTGIPLQEQEAYLKLVQPYLNSGAIQGIRLSTRPDYINAEILDLLEQYRITTIELGAQSMDDEVLQKSHRGHSAQQVVDASRLIIDRGFKLGLQMMVGLPGDSFESSLMTAQKIVNLGAHCTRIYPTLVIKDTALHQWYTKGKFVPLTLKTAVEWVSQLLPVFEQGGVKIIRTGLHPSEGLVKGKDLIAGPYHPQFRELVLSTIWLKNLLSLVKQRNGQHVVFEIPVGQKNYAIGFGGQNRNELLKKVKSVKFIECSLLNGREVRVKVSD
jgi:histone acetyltransferase (RNA polymerase elongator complex component)